MPTLLELRRRTRSVKNTEQITRAMKMVATARLRRSQEAIISARPFAKRILSVLNAVVPGASETADHPLLRVRPERRVLIVVVSSDRGLCGSFNANVIKQCETLLESLEDRDIGVRPVGRKAKDHFRRQRVQLVDPLEDIFRALGYEHARSIAGPLMERYSRPDPDDPERLDAVYLVFNEFRNILRQDVRVERLLPLARLDLPGEEDGRPPVEFLFEPDEARIFADLLPRHVEYQVWRALLESAAAEQAARMTAMDNASRNAKELIAELTLTMNRVRQAAITNEILEVVGGAEALGKD